MQNMVLRLALCVGVGWGYLEECTSSQQILDIKCVRKFLCITILFFVFKEGNSEKTEQKQKTIRLAKESLINKGLKKKTIDNPEHS